MKWVPGEGTFSKKGGVKIPLNPDDFQLFHGIESEKILKDHTFFTYLLTLSDHSLPQNRIIF